jgi:hypothetical protein
VVVYLLIALCLYPDDDYEEVAEKLPGMLALVPRTRWEAPTRGAIIQARQRLGTEAVKEVFQQVARPAATEATLGAGYRDAHGVLVVVLREPSVVKHLERLERGRVAVEVVD